MPRSVALCMSKPSKGDTVTVWEVVLGRKNYKDELQPYLLSRVGVCTGKSIRFDPSTCVEMYPFHGPVCTSGKSLWPVADLAFTEQDALNRWVRECGSKVEAANRALHDALALARAEIVRPVVDRG